MNDTRPSRRSAELDRRSFYEKELQLRMSMSYGPGRYERREDAGPIPI